MAELLRFPGIPNQIPMVMQDLCLMRCTTCGDLVPGLWGISREKNQVGVDHYLDAHPAMVAANVWTTPPIVNAVIQDPFWFDEHAAASSASPEGNPDPNA